MLDFFIMDDVKTFEFTKKYVMRKIVDETILVPVSPLLKQRDTLIALNPIAASMLEKVRSGVTLQQAQSDLLAEFDVDATELENDLRQFIQTMADAEVIRELHRGD